ncbi:hypothetical protein [Streptomyces coelicoflavus]|uniref:hypothetical protein n=1 Tax=Streptomyces coelicoflavus TaxID=285562 RepID=UPI000D59280F|nr:hypothetical protein [Streptomyces coelicoflavus]
MSAEHARQRSTATVEEPGTEGADAERVGAGRVAAPTETSEEARQLAATVAEAALQSSHEEVVANRVATDGARLLAVAEASVLRAQRENGSRDRPDARPKPPPRAERGDLLQTRALARAAAAPSQEQRDLPLWAGRDLPTGVWRQEHGVLHDAYGVPQWRLRRESEKRSLMETPAGAAGPAAPETNAYEPVGLRQAFISTVAKAWADVVPPEHGTVADLLEAVDEPLRELEKQWWRNVPFGGSDSEQHATPTRTRPVPSRRDPEPVDAALRQTDAHAAALQDFPEWQRLQTVRGATAHLWSVLHERAGAYFSRLRTDLRVQGFWRTVSLRSVKMIGHCAQVLANRLRSGLHADPPTAEEALLSLGDAALAYSTPGIPRPAHPVRVAADAAVNNRVDVVRRPSAALGTGAPVPYGAREEAVHASREIAEAFQTWRQTLMGHALTTSVEHPRVVAFRQAWQRLPTADLPDGPGTAAGPYGDVGRSALALVERAEATNAQRARAGQPARFAAVDVDALRAIATMAEHHSGRLAVTLPPGLTRPAFRRTPALQAATSSLKAVAPTTSSGIRVAPTTRSAPTFRGLP